MLTRIIAVTDFSAKGVHSKFVRRLNHVQNTLMPSLRAIGLEPEIFPALIGSEVPFVDGKAVHGDLRLTHGSGCIGNLLSNYELWKLSVERQQDVLILEDDAILPAANQIPMEKAINAFLMACEQNDILYLLGQSPSIKDSPRRYAPSELESPCSHLARLKSTADLSCTAAYMVTPDAASALMSRLDKAPTIPTDGFVHTAFRAGAIGVMVQTDPTKGFMLNDNWAEWNHKHDPSLIQP